MCLCNYLNYECLYVWIVKIALVVNKMKDELGDVTGEEVDGLKPNFYLIVVSDSSAYKKAKRCQ